MVKPITENTLFYGDNLPILREYIPDESIDLIYLDPPFNSNRTYNVLFKQESGQDSEAQIAAFEDTWHWNQAAEETYHELVTAAPPHVGKMIGALRGFIVGSQTGGNQMMAYLVMMAARLVELHRILKPTGSLYLHCDPTASHYLKVVLDTIFGPTCFINEIVWERSQTRSSISKSYRRAHDILFFYAKSPDYLFNMQFRSLSDASLENYRHEDEKGRYRLVPLLVSGVRKGVTGRPWRGVDPNIQGKSGMHWVTTHEKLDEYERQGLVVISRNGIPNLKYYLEQSPGVPLNDNWHDITLIPASSKEALGYPTQKPIALLERIIAASSNPGDIVLDPFCGCGTTIAAAQKLDRRWVGIDITYLSIALQKNRLNTAFPDAKYKVIGEPTTLHDARQLAVDDRFQFQWWAVSLIKARPYGGQEGSKQGKKGADKGIDGIIIFIDDHTRQPKRVIVQVKSGKVNSRDIRDLVGTLNRESAAIGVFLTLEEPTRDMRTEATTAGFYHSPGWNQKYPRIQILTVKALLEGTARLEMPPAEFTTFKQAQQVKEEEHKQKGLFD